MINEKYGRLTVIEQAPKTPGRRAFNWLCKCDCGELRVVPTDKLRSGHTKSCGCLNRDTARELMTKHGLKAAHPDEYRVWKLMKRRCNNPNSKEYPNWGGRGIKVLEPWASDFAAFFRDMGPRPSAKHQIDRIDNNGPYAPGNCRWVTPSENCNNTSKNVWIEYAGEIHTVTEWAKILGISRFTLYTRLKHGWPIAKVLSRSVRASSRNREGREA